ncbi:hypothetical protein AFAEC_1194 [Aliarcobacter faecis]|uniref:hypothetical protein n=1 Tax=Aliarcobacter faecis TaxID=1564138 RepID=UPI0004790EDD|nr:hypothetical protein [Aliarcobacter faecis]QKF73359.1 hypothetical protein AFAEC_1194 [Aliarcobacter faecis]
MYKFLFLLAIPLIFVACTPKNSAFRFFDKGLEETKAVKYTKKADIVKDKEVDVIFMATYLNMVDKKLDLAKKEQFLVFTYFAKEQSQDMEKNGYTIYLNQKEPILFEKIEKDDEKYKDYMLKNHWGTYYLVEFENLNNIKNFSLVLQNQESNKATLSFVK